MFGFFRRFVRFDIAFASEAGLARADNQDCLFVDGGHKVFCVADGMGGGEGGAIASRLVCEEVARSTTVHDFVQRISAADAGIQRANQRIRARAANLGFGKMGTTIATLLIDPSDGSQAAIGHVGDTRVYRRRAHVLERLTEDHRKSPLSHFLTRAVGAEEQVRVEWLHASVRKGDVWLICCDGVHDMLPDSTINGILARGGTAKELVARLSDAVLRAGARDNYTLVVVKI